MLLYTTQASQGCFQEGHECGQSQSSWEGVPIHLERRQSRRNSFWVPYLAGLLKDRFPKQLHSGIGQRNQLPKFHSRIPHQEPSSSALALILNEEPSATHFYWIM